ncbi:hypothetical protein PhaeoP78_02572 [Phaeobacter inhibens]|nr:hypothetical protein PhaeoP78_02572 [Phaeobacter inhibens]
MNDRDNDHVEVIDIDGFMADDLHGAFKEALAISKATQCKRRCCTNPGLTVGPLSPDRFTLRAL